MAAARVFGTLITATRDGPRKLPSPLESGAQNDRSSPGTDSFTRKLPHWRGMVLHRGADALGWACQRNSEVQRFCWLFLAVI
jgi:hypothetical protein